MIGISHGAISIVNGIPCGVGAAVGISLNTTVSYKESDSISIKTTIKDTTMAEICVKRSLERFHISDVDGYSLTIETEIPPSIGLKSSSSVCNAIVNALCSYYHVELDNIEKIRLGVECAKEAGVTITGAFDDACACALGGFVVCDNNSDRIIEQRAFPEYDVIICLPEGETLKNVPLNLYRKRMKEFEDILLYASNDPLNALTSNGRLVSDIAGYDTNIIDEALSYGALAAGVSGTGPAVSIVAEKGMGKEIASLLGRKHIMAVTR